MDRKLWYIKNAALFSWLGEEELKNLAERSIRLTSQESMKNFFTQNSLRLADN